MMVLVRSLSDFDGGNPAFEKVWHVGRRLVDDPDFLPTIVQADGDELEWVTNNFVNLPYPKDAPVVRWYGDLARMIWDALPKTYL